jgi:hypothetical protein
MACRLIFKFEAAVVARSQRVRPEVAAPMIAPRRSNPALHDGLDRFAEPVSSPASRRLAARHCELDFFRVLFKIVMPFPPSVGPRRAVISRSWKSFGCSM